VSTVYLVTAQTQDKFNNFDLIMTAGAKSAKGLVSFVATDPNLVNNVTFVNGTPVATTPSSGGMSLNFRIREWFKSFFKGLASWWSYLIAVIVVIAVIIALILISPTIIHLIKSVVLKQIQRKKTEKMITHMKLPEDRQNLNRESLSSRSINI